MRYRPLGATGRTVSVVTLAVGEAPRGEAERVALVYAALEAGVNSFELRTDDPGAARALGRALSAVERDLVVVSLRLPHDPARGSRDRILGGVEAALLSSRLGRLDLLVLDEWPAIDSDALAALAAAKAADRIGYAGAAGEAFDRVRHRAEIDALVCGYSLRAGWPERNRIRLAVERGKFVVGQDSYPDLGAAAAASDGPPPVRTGGFLGLGRKVAPIERTGGYAFMRRAPGWEPDEICLAYALTEPSLATVVVEAQDPGDVERLASVAERELPTGMPAQIEMARFAAHG